MIKFENAEVVGLEAAIRGMRNPKNSWERSDSFCVSDCHDCPDYNNCEGANDISYDPYRSNGYIGPNDLDLMKRLAAGGPVHAKFRRMITVYVDITAPLYWWKEFDTYKVGTVANSCSTMHKIHAKEFVLDDFSHEQLISNWIDNNVESFVSFGDALNFEPKVDWSHGKEYNLNGGVLFSPKDILSLTIHALNACRQAFLTTKDKKFWWQMIQLLPSSYNQKRTVMMNYEVLAGIYPMRKNHKLDEWSEHTVKSSIYKNTNLLTKDFGFCDWIKTLPHYELITRDTKETVELFADGKKVATLENGLTPDDLLKKYTPNQVREAFGYPPAQDFSKYMKPPVKEEIYIEDILTRADVMWYSDMINGSRVVKSRNTKEPLTEQEQECLKRMWRNQGFRGDVIFYVEEVK